MKSTFLIAAALTLTTAGPARAAVKTREIEYTQGSTPLKGFLAWNDAAKGKRPGILVVHEWWGLNQHARNQAVRLAKAGYVALALDMYGDGKVATHPKDAQAFAAEATKDPEVVKARFDAARSVLEQQSQVDPEKIAAIGYCMGGSIALAMACGGEDLDAVATFHASVKQLATGDQKCQPHSPILVQTGGADPFVPKEDVQQFEQRLKEAGAQLQVVTYPNAKHSFTNPDAAKAGMDALAYDKQADQKSWDRLTKFLKSAFGK